MHLDVLEMGKTSVKKHTHSRVETDPWQGSTEARYQTKNSQVVTAGYLTVNMKPFTQFAYFPQLQSCRSRAIALFC